MFIKGTTGSFITTVIFSNLLGQDIKINPDISEPNVIPVYNTEAAPPSKVSICIWLYEVKKK